MLHSAAEGLRMIVGLVSAALAEPVKPCTERWSGRALDEVVAAADRGTAAMDPAAFLAARDQLLARLACVDEPLAGTTVGAVHRVVATGAFLEEADARIAPALAGLLAADPGHQLSTELYPEGHPIRKLLVHAGLLAREPAGRPLRVLASGWLEVDGLSATRLPATRASIVQELDGQGAVVATRYVWPDDDLGAWAASTDAGPSTLPTDPPAAAKKPGPARVPMAVATAVSVVATGVLYGLARSEYDAFHDTSVSRDPGELVAMQSRVNSLSIWCVSAGAASVGLGVGLALAW